MCFAPHIASPTSPVSVCLPAASAGLEQNRLAELSSAATKIERFQLPIITALLLIRCSPVRQRSSGLAGKCIKSAHFRKFPVSQRGHGKINGQKAVPFHPCEIVPKAEHLWLWHAPPPSCCLLACPYGIDDIDVDGLVSHVGGHVR